MSIKPTPDPENWGSKSHRTTARRYISWALKELAVSQAALARVTGYSPATIEAYLAGRRTPSSTFLLDFLDKIPLADMEFKLISPLLAIKRGEPPSLDKFRRKPLSAFLAAARVSARRTRDLYAAELGVSTQQVYDVEHGLIPDVNYLKRVARALPPTINLDDIIAAFPVLRPTAQDIKIQRSLERIRAHPTADPLRGRLENALAAELMPEARKMAVRVASRINRPEYADEVWGEALALAIKHQKPERGLFTSYLGYRIRGLIYDIMRSDLQTGTATVLSDYSSAVNEAEDALFQRLGRNPTDDEVAAHMDMSPRKVGEVRRARAACRRSENDNDNLEFWLQHAVDVGSSQEGPLVASQRLLRGMPADWRETLYLHFHDRLSISEISDLMGLPEDSVDDIVGRALRIIRREGEGD